MARYRVISQSSIDAIELQFDMTVSIEGELVEVTKGSFLMTREDGGQAILSRTDFLSQYEPVPAVGRKKKVAGQEALSQSLDGEG